MLRQSESAGSLVPVDLAFSRNRGPRQSNLSADNVSIQYRSKRSASRITFSGEKGTGKLLSELEEDFIFAAEFGDIPTVKKILDANPTFNVDFSDILGRTPLRLAVGNEHLEVAELLLDRSSVASIHEALLQAISSDHEQIAETILKHPKYQGMKKEQKKFGDDHFFNTASEDSPFSSDITPLILAAERNQIEIVQLLLLRGETIKKPHHYYCNCQECSNKLEYDQLRLAKTRLNAYKGQSSGAYISLSSSDPILTAFELARELRDVAKVEKYYKTEYLSLADQLSAYTVSLLDKVRGHDELELVINKTGRDSDEESYERLSRFKLAIKYKEKKFVAHPSCQQKLVSIWYSDLRELQRSNWFFRGLLVTIVALVYPLLCVLYLLVPKSKIGRFLRYPCIKFIGHTLSFIIFLIMLVTSSAMESASAGQMSNFQPQHEYYQQFRDNTVVVLRGNASLPADFWIRTYQPQIINLILSLWIIGMLWQNMKQVYSDGIYSYFGTLYNHLEFTVLALYITSFTLRFLSLMMVLESINYFASKESWVRLSNGDFKSQEKFYWLIADRLFWESWDPHNLAECMFAVANVLSFTRLSYILPANELFGPMQISLARMIGDILKFGAVFMVVFFAFIVGLHNLYWYYPKEVRRHVEIVENSITTHAENHFGIPENTLRTVFWSLFGRGESTVVELTDFEHYVTETIGYWLFGVYNIATVIVLLNMLIAMMSRSFEIIQGEADTEWKFARSKLYMDYIQDDSTLPVPFNIVPTFKSLISLIKAFSKRCCGQYKDGNEDSHPNDLERPSHVRNGVSGMPVPKHGTQSQRTRKYQQSQQTSNGFFSTDSEPDIYSEKLTYKRVMKRIVKRYIFDLQRDQDAKNGDFDEIKQDISSFRFEMLNHLNMRQEDHLGKKDKLDHLYAKLDAFVIQQKEIAHWLTASDESSAAGQYFLSTCSESTRSSIDSYKAEDDGVIIGTNGLKQMNSNTKKIRSGYGEADRKSEINVHILSDNMNEDFSDNIMQVINLEHGRALTKREEMLRRQEDIGSSIEDETNDHVACSHTS